MQIISHSTTETIKLGTKIAKGLKRGDIICLFGELGSGKTVLTKGIAQGLGISKDKIISPTFVFIREHKAAVNLFHFDLYRMREAEEILGLGYEEYFFDEGISVVEWAQRLKYLLPKEYLKINLKIMGQNARKIMVTPRGSRYNTVCQRLEGSKGKNA